MDFREFFRHATNFGPYDWQTKVAVNGLPEILPIPTGLGKTEGSVLAWAWRKLHLELSEPLHLVYCLPMRSLICQTVDRLRACFDALAAKRRLQEVRVYQLMGGALDEDWAEEPDRPWVLVGTQDQLLSRALNRGYAMSRFNWPVHFGLLNQDCHWIIDEMQLMGPGLWTTAQLDWMRRKRFPALKDCRSTWMSATMGIEFLQTTDRKRDGCDKVEPFNPGFDGDSNDELKRRRMARRPTGMHQPAKGNKAKPVPEQIAAEAKAAHLPGTLTLIVCNTVKTAQDIFQNLETGDTQKILITSRFRASDRRAAEETLRDFEASRSASSTSRVEGDPGLICVSTQVIEAGLDISAHRLWTEHAPWPSLIQRLGRLNRDGKANEEAWAVVWTLASENKRKFEGEDWIGPYKKIALDCGSRLVEQFAPLSKKMTAAAALAELETLAPTERAKALAVPPEPCPRALDVHGLFSIEQDLHGGFTDVSRFVRNADPDADATVFWRDWQGGAPPSGDALDGPPLDPNTETCAVAQWRLQKLLKTASAPAWLWNDEAGVWASISHRELKPGMTVMLGRNLGGYSQDLGWTGERKNRLNGLPPPGPGRALRDDPRAEAGYWSTLASHIANSRREAENLCSSLDLQDEIRAAVVEAAALDDLGKAHPDWQSKLPKGGPIDDEIIAKFPPVLRVETATEHANAVKTAIEAQLADFRCKDRPLAFSLLANEAAKDSRFVLLRWALTCRLGRDAIAAIEAVPSVRWARHRAFRPGLDDKGMRHEAASALAMWWQYITSNEPTYPALAVYLAAAHHGKVRTVMRAISRQGGDVFGVARCPEALEYDGRSWPMAFSVAFDGAEGDWTEDGFMRSGPGWTGIVADLLGPWRGEADATWTGSLPKDEPRALGPFALAWLEALVRVADWRASERPSHIIRPGDGG